MFGFASHDGAQIRYFDSGGDDSGAPIVFVPGFTCVADDYTAAAAQFGRRTIIVELRGHGGSVAPTGPYDSATIAGDVGAVVDHITDGPVHLVTFSRGTTYALTWALAHRGRVRSVSIGDYPPEEIVLPAEHIRIVLDGRWRGTPVHERVDRDAAIATLAAATARSLWEPLAQWGVPLLAVRSPNSPIVDDAAWARYQRDFPGARLHEFTDSPHDIFRPDRGRYPSLVRELVDGVDGRSRDGRSRDGRSRDGQGR